MRRFGSALGVVLLLSALLYAGGQALAGACDVPGQITVGRDGWTVIRPPAFPSESRLHDFAVDPYDPRRMFATNGIGVMRSIDGGCYWSDIYTATSAQISSIVVPESADERGRVYLLLDRDIRPGAPPPVILSADGGETWEESEWSFPQGTIKSLTQDASDAPVELVIAPSDPNTAYLFTRDATFLSDDGGHTWHPVREVVDDLAGGDGMRFSQAEADPYDANVLWATGYQGVFRSNDGAVTWTRLDEPVGSYEAIDLAPAAGGKTSMWLFGAGVFASTDGGKTWDSHVSPAPVQGVTQVGPGNNIVVAANGEQGAAYALDPRTGRWLPIKEQDPPLADIFSDRTAAMSLFAYSTAVGGAIYTIDYDAALNYTLPPPPAPTPPPIPEVRCEALESDLRETQRDRTPTHLSPEHVTMTLAPGQEGTVPYELELTSPVLGVDVFFLIDTTNSMSAGLCGIREGIAAIAGGLMDRHVDPYFGVGHFTVHGQDPFEAVSAGGGPYVRDHDLTPPDAQLIDALNGIEIYGGGPESQLTALYQAVTGAGEAPAVGGSGVPAGQNAHFRADAVKLIVHVTDEYFGGYEGLGAASQPNPQGPDFSQVITALNAADVNQIGLGLGPFSGGTFTPAAELDPWGHLRDLRRVASETSTLAPEDGVDCDSDGDVDIGPREPIVCPIEYEQAQEQSGGMATAILETVLATVEPAIVDLVELSSTGAVARIKPETITGFDLLNRDSAPFAVAYECSGENIGKVAHVELGARVNGRIVATADAAIACGLPALRPIDPKLAFFVPPPPPPAFVAPKVHAPAPAPKIAPAPEPQPAPAQQTAVQTQPAAVAQEQEEPQAAFVHASQSLREQTGPAMVRYRGHAAPFAQTRTGVAAGALTLMLAYGVVSASLARSSFQRRRRR